jgi:hypothetical protein
MVRLNLNEGHVSNPFTYTEGAPIMYGLPMPPRNWAPFYEQTIPPQDRLPAFGQWVTAYFDHADVKSGDLDKLTYVIPSTDRPGTVYNMTAKEQSETIFTGTEAAVEGPYMQGLQSQLNEVFKLAILDKKTRDSFPHLKLACVTGTRAPAWAIASYWVLEKESSSGLPIRLELLAGANHFVSAKFRHFNTQTLTDMCRSIGMSLSDFLTQFPS